jgi:hypothetical protein
MDRCLEIFSFFKGRSMKKIEELDLSFGKLHREKELNKLFHYNYKTIIMNVLQGKVMVLKKRNF